MKGRNLLVAMFIVGLILALTILPSQAAAADVIRWKGQTFASGPAGQAGHTFGQWIEKRTGGRLVMNVEPPGTIVPPPQMFRAVTKGLLDFAGTYPGSYHAGIMPEADIDLGLPLGWEYSEEVWESYYRRGLLELMREAYAERDVYFLAPCPMGQFSQVQATFPVKSLKDLKGKKIGGVGIVAELIKLMGATPVNIPYPERYMALKLGTIDGMLTGASMLEDAKLKELVTHMIASPNINCYSNAFLVNMNSWKKLPDDIKKILNEETRYLIADQASMLDGIEGRLAIAKAVKEYKLKLVTLPDEEVEWLRDQAYNKIWPIAAAKTPKCAKMVELLKQQMRDFGRLK